MFGVAATIVVAFGSLSQSPDRGDGGKSPVRESHPMDHPL